MFSRRPCALDFVTQGQKRDEVVEKEARLVQGRGAGVDQPELSAELRHGQRGHGCVGTAEMTAQVHLEQHRHPDHREGGGREIGGQRPPHPAAHDQPQLGDPAIVEVVVPSAQESRQPEQPNLLGLVAAGEYALQVGPLPVGRGHAVGDWYAARLFRRIARPSGTQASAMIGSTAGCTLISTPLSATRPTAPLVR